VSAERNALELTGRYRIFAELLECGVQSGLRLAFPPAPLLPTLQSAGIAPTHEYWATPVSSLNPLQTLQSPAFYYYTAASCSVQRQKRFEEALLLEVSMSFLGIELNS
jgi:hypothetical protein